MQNLPFHIRVPIWRIVQAEEPYYLAGQVLGLPGAPPLTEEDRSRMRRTWILRLDAAAMQRLHLNENQLRTFLQWYRIETPLQRPVGGIADVQVHDVIVVLPEAALALPTTEYFVGQPENIRAGISVPPSLYIEHELQSRQEEFKPRLLSREEREDILGVIPEVFSASQEAAQMTRQQIIATMREKLQTIKMTPLGIPDFKAEMVREFERSRVQPGSTSGIAAAESLGGPITQMSLNTFHVAGSSKNVSYGIDGIRELLNVSKKRRHPSTTIHFTDRTLNYDQVFAKRIDLVDVSISDLITDFDVDLTERLERYWWHDVYAQTIQAAPPSKWVLRLYFDSNQLYAHRITLAIIAAKLQESQGVFCIPSPLSEDEPIIDVLPDEAKVIQTKLYKTPSEQAQAAALKETEIGLYYLQNIVVPSLDKIQLKGVPGIKRLYPVVSPVWQVIRDEYTVYDEPTIQAEPDETKRGLMRRAWYIIYNEFRMRLSGIGPDSIRRLCQAAGMYVNQEGSSYMVVIMPEVKTEWLEEEKKKPEKERRNLLKPGPYIQFVMERDDAAERAAEEEKRKAGVRFPRIPPTPVQAAGKYVYAETNGSNLWDLLVRPDIDANRTICNDFIELMEVLGLEATRNYLVKELLEVLGYDGSYTNPSQIILLVDYMTNRAIRDRQTGKYRPTPITFTGISRQPIGVLAKASNERAMETFRDAAGYGAEEKILSTSTSIYVGQKAKVGTGFVDLEIDEAKIREYEARMQAQEVAGAAARVDPENLRQVLNRIDDQAWGVEPITFDEAAENELERAFGGEAEPVPAIPVAQIAPVTGGVPQVVNIPALIKPRVVIPTQLAGILPQLPAAPGQPVPGVRTTVATLPTPGVPALPRVPIVLPETQPVNAGAPQTFTTLLNQPK